MITHGMDYIFILSINKKGGDVLAFSKEKTLLLMEQVSTGLYFDFLYTEK